MLCSTEQHGSAEKWNLVIFYLLASSAHLTSPVGQTHRALAELLLATLPLLLCSCRTLFFGHPLNPCNDLKLIQRLEPPLYLSALAFLGLVGRPLEVGKLDITSLCTGSERAPDQFHVWQKLLENDDSGKQMPFQRHMRTCVEKGSNM